MNILILSSGTRNKLVTYFMKELKDIGKVVCTDCSQLAPTLYIANKYYIVPRIDDSEYLKVILEICRKENIHGVFSLIDPELSLISKNKGVFTEMGITPFVSEFKKVEMCFNKYEFYKFCKKNGFPTVKTYIDINEFKKDYETGKIDFPVFIKPVMGSCSINIQRIDNLVDLESCIEKYSGLIIQEFMDCQEFGVDVYIDMISHKTVSIFAKKKILMRAGETDKAVSYIDEKLFNLIDQFVQTAGFEGPIDIDIFKKGDQYYLSEVNPRFGGGYPLAYECGCNFPRYLLNNLMSKENTPVLGQYDSDVYMMKYLDLKILKNKRELYEEK